MTERSIGNSFKWFIAEVVNRGDGKEGKKDNTQSGRVQIRVFGKHDDKKNIPDDKLPWAAPLLPIGSGAGLNGQGTAPVGLKKGTRVFGFFADKDETIPVLIGILVKAGKDPSPDGDGETIKPEESSVPKGARDKDADGGDKNDVLNKRLTEEVGKEGQFHGDKKTIGSLPFDGSGVLDAIKKADPNNISGSIQGALAGMKSMTNTLGVAGSLLSNFQKIISGKFAIGDLLKVTAQVVAITAVVKAATADPPKQVLKYNAGDYIIDIIIDKGRITAQRGPIVVNIVNNYDKNGYLTGVQASLTNNNQIVISGTIAQIEAMAKTISEDAVKVVQAAKSGSASASATRSAFNGGNPMSNIISALGGLPGLLKLASQASGLLGPLTGSFGPAVAISNMLRTTTQTMFAGMQPAPFRSPLPPQLAGIAGNIGNIAGITGALNAGLTGITGALGGVTGPLGAAVGGLNQITSLVNSAITLPVVSLAALNGISRANPGIVVGLNPNIAKGLNTVIAIGAVASAVNRGASFGIQPGYQYNSSTYNINSLQNSSISLSVPPILTTSSFRRTANRNVGVNLALTGTLLQQLGR